MKNTPSPLSIIFLLHALQLLIFIYFYRSLSESEDFAELLFLGLSLPIKLILSYFISIGIVVLFCLFVSEIRKRDRFEYYYAILKGALIYLPFIFIPDIYVYPITVFGTLQAMAIYAVVLLLVGGLIMLFAN